MKLPFEIGKELASYVLPYPPSSNGLYANRKSHKPGQKGRIKTDKYKLWREAAGKEIIAQGRKGFLQKVVVVIEARPPDKRKRDSDNIAKATLDLLVLMSVIPDDSNRHICGHFPYWNTGAHGITVRLYEVEE